MSNQESFIKKNMAIFTGMAMLGLAMAVVGIFVARRAHGTHRAVAVGILCVGGLWLIGMAVWNRRKGARALEKMRKMPPGCQPDPPVSRH